MWICVFISLGFTCRSGILSLVKAVCFTGGETVKFSEVATPFKKSASNV